MTTSTALVLHIITPHEILTATTYYAKLGVPENATTDDIRRAFRKLAGMYHPDKFDGPDAVFKMLSEAHAVLTDPEQRELYDRFGDIATQDRAAFTEALHLLPRLFMQAVRDGSFNPCIDYIKELEKYIQNTFREITKERQHLNKVEKDHKKIEKRIKKRAEKSGGTGNMFLEMFKEQYKHIEAQRDALKKKEFLHEIMLKILKDYWFDAMEVAETRPQRRHFDIGIDDIFKRDGSRWR